MAKTLRSFSQLQAKAILEQRRRQFGDRPPYYEYADKPIEFAQEILELKHLTHEQKMIMLSVLNNRETNVQAGHGVGKTFLAAVIVLWWVFAVGGLAITTAPTENQVKELLWSEIRKMHKKYRTRLGGQCLEMRVRYSETARAYGFTARDYSPDSFQGIHGERLLAIQDEASGITEEIDNGFESCITGASNRGLRIGNPVAPGTPFEKSCRTRSIKIPVWSHPNISWAYQQDTDGVFRLKPDVAEKLFQEVDGTVEILPQDQWPDEFPRDLIPGAVSVSWVESMRAKKGESSTFWMSRLNADFPTDSYFSIVPRSWFIAARARYDNNQAYWDSQAEPHKWRHGLDVGDGGDPHAAASWKGSVLYRVEEQHTLGDMEDVSRAAAMGKKMLRELDGTIRVDNIGVGSGALSELLQDDKYKTKAFGFKFSKSASDTAAFTNIRAESYWKLREAFQEEQIAIAPLGQDMEEQLMDELSGIMYEELATEKIRIEDKKKTIKRIGRSPNIADSVVYGFIKPKPKPQRRGATVSYTTA